MSPGEQIAVGEITESIQAFKELGVPLAILFIVGLVVIAIILYIVFNYKLSNTLATRDTARAQVDSEATARQDEILGKMADMLSASQGSIARTLEAVAGAQEKIASTLLTVGQHTILLPALSENVTKHDQRAEKGIADILGAIVDLKGQFTAFEAKFDLRFPPGVEFKTEFEELRLALESVAKRCEEVKRSTDENKVVLLPEPIHPAEDESALTPGAAAA